MIKTNIINFNNLESSHLLTEKLVEGILNLSRTTKKIGIVFDFSITENIKSHKELWETLSLNYKKMFGDLNVETSKKVKGMTYYKSGDRVFSMLVFIGAPRDNQNEFAQQFIKNIPKKNYNATSLNASLLRLAASLQEIIKNDHQEPKDFEGIASVLNKGPLHYAPLINGSMKDVFKSMLTFDVFSSKLADETNIIVLGVNAININIQTSKPESKIITSNEIMHIFNEDMNASQFRSNKTPTMRLNSNQNTAIEKNIKEEISKPSIVMWENYWWKGIEYFLSQYCQMTTNQEFSLKTLELKDDKKSRKQSIDNKNIRPENMEVRLFVESDVNVSVIDQIKDKTTHLLMVDTLEEANLVISDFDEQDQSWQSGAASDGVGLLKAERLKEGRIVPLQIILKSSLQDKEESNEILLKKALDEIYYKTIIQKNGVINTAFSNKKPHKIDFITIKKRNVARNTFNYFVCIGSIVFDGVGATIKSVSVKLLDNRSFKYSKNTSAEDALYFLELNNNQIYHDFVSVINDGNNQNIAKGLLRSDTTFIFEKNERDQIVQCIATVPTVGSIFVDMGFNKAFSLKDEIIRSVSNRFCSNSISIAPESRLKNFARTSEKDEIRFAEGDGGVYFYRMLYAVNGKKPFKRTALSFVLNIYQDDSVDKDNIINLIESLALGEEFAKSGKQIAQKLLPEKIASLVLFD